MASHFSTSMGAASWGDSRLDIFAVNPSFDVFHKTWDGLAWRPSQSGWDPLFPQNGVFTPWPGVTSWGPNRLDIFVPATHDFRLLHRTWAGSWLPSVSTWEDLQNPTDAYFPFGPAVTSWLNRLDVIILSGNNRLLYHKACNTNAWDPWEPLAGLVCSRPPAAVSWGLNRVDVFAIGAEDDAMYQKTSNGVTWSPWNPLGGKFFKSPGLLTSVGPAAVSWRPQRLDVFGIGVDGHLLHRAWDTNPGIDGHVATGWFPSSAWDDRGTPSDTVTCASTPAVASWGPERLDIFCVGSDGVMYHTGWNGNWLLWESLGSPAADIKFESAPTVVSWGCTRLDIFCLGTNNAMYHKAWDVRGWHPSLTNWEPLSGAFLKPLEG